jgi:RNA polymerase sigma-70 factor (ECF subfamily)
LSEIGRRIPVQPVSCVRTFKDYQAVRSPCHDGTSDAWRSRVEACAGLESAFAALAAGDADALADLYARAGAEIFGLALWRTGSRDDAADVVQDVFVKLMAERGRLAAVRRPRAWLLTVAHRCALDIVRRRRCGVSLVEPEGLDDLLEPLLEEPDRKVDAARLSTLLHSLPDAQREALYLRHFVELSFRDIGAVTGVSLFTAATRYRLGLDRLRRRLRVRA